MGDDVDNVLVPATESSQSPGQRGVQGLRRHGIPDCELRAGVAQVDARQRRQPQAAAAPVSDHAVKRSDVQWGQPTRSIQRAPEVARPWLLPVERAGKDGRSKGLSIEIGV